MHEIGTIEFQVGSAPVQATLKSNLAWSCADAEIANFLNAVFAIDPTLDPNDPQVIHRLYQAAERLGARVTSRPSESPAAGDLASA